MIYLMSYEFCLMSYLMSYVILSPYDLTALVVRVAQVVKVNVDRANVDRRVVEVEWNLVRGALVLRGLLCGLRRCH